MKKYSFIKFIALIFIVAMAASVAFAEQGGKGTSSSNKTQLKAGDSYDFFINNVDMPLGRDGVLADVAIGSQVGGGKLNNKIFLFSGGFYLSGLNNGQIWANGQMSASRVQDYTPGTYANGQNDSRAQLYIVKSSDPDFSQSWQEWKDAVALGADFYDGDGDHQYNPADKNGNGKWDPDEDRPDILGDATAWCVYSDQRPAALRTWNDVSPQGIEVRQTVFGFNSKAVIGNMVFIRYKIVNTGLYADVLDSVYMSIVDDADVGDSGANDLVGCDTLLNCGYTYHKFGASDAKWGATPPCFLVDFFQGPRSYIPGVTFTDNNANGVYDAGDVALDTAIDVRGKVLGYERFPGAKNLGISSFFTYPNGQDPSDRFQGRFYTLGLTRNGGVNDPCVGGGIVTGVDCKLVDPYFMYSGDPITGIGWVHDAPADQRQLSNTGPFKLVKNEPVSIIVAYIIGQGTSYLNSITVAKTNDVIAKKVFKANFPSLPPPPAVEVSAKTGDGIIDIAWPTSVNIKYKAIDSVFAVNRNVHGFFITEYFTNAKAPVVNNLPNSIIVPNSRYDVKNFIQNLYTKLENGGIELKEATASASNKLDSLVLADSSSGRIVFRLTSDPATGNDLIKGHEYYFTVTEYTINNWAIVNKATGKYDGTVGDYLDPSGSSIEEFETPIITVRMGSDEFNPVMLNTPSKKVNGPSSGSVKYVVVDQTKLTGNNYKVAFTSDTVTTDGLYTPSWSLINISTSPNDTLLKSQTVYNFDTLNYTGTPVQGIVPRIQPLSAEFGTPIYSNNGVKYPDSTIWYTPFGGIVNGKGVFYLGKDLAVPTSTQVGIGYDSINPVRSTYITADKLRKVELRFGDSSYAYRYINGFIGANLTAQRGSTIYAEGIGASDTTGKGVIGNWDPVTNHASGFIKVPFSVWVVDTANTENRQLAIGIIERRKSLKGNPDGIWDPGTLLATGSAEVILAFDAPYDPTGSQIEYTGNSSKWAELVKGYDLNAPGSTAAQIAKAKSPWLNTMYLFALQRKGAAFFAPGDKLTVPMVTYPYTSTDVFQFTTKNPNISDADKKALFEKVNVFPNPLYGYNSQTSYNNQVAADDPFVTFSNLPGDVTINIFSLSGTRLRTLKTTDKLGGPTSPFLRWDLKNEAGLRMASGMYLAIVSSPGYGNKVLKFAIIMPQKQIKSY